MERVQAQQAHERLRTTGQAKGGKFGKGMGVQYPWCEMKRDMTPVTSTLEEVSQISTSILPASIWCHRVSPTLTCCVTSDLGSGGVASSVNQSVTFSTTAPSISSLVTALLIPVAARAKGAGFKR